MFSCAKRPHNPGYYYDPECDSYFKIPPGTDPTIALCPPRAIASGKSLHKPPSPKFPYKAHHKEPIVFKSIADSSLAEIHTWLRFPHVRCYSAALERWRLKHLTPDSKGVRIALFPLAKNIWDWEKQCFYRVPVHAANMTSNFVYFENKFMKCRPPNVTHPHLLHNDNSSSSSDTNESDREDDSRTWQEEVLLYDVGGRWQPGQPCRQPPVQFACILERSPTRMFAWSQVETVKESGTKSKLFLHTIDPQLRIPLTTKMMPRSVNPQRGNSSLLTIACMGGIWNRKGQNGIMLEKFSLTGSGHHFLVQVENSSCQNTYCVHFTRENELVVSTGEGDLRYLYLDELGRVQNRVDLPVSVTTGCHHGMVTSTRLVPCDNVLVHPTRPNELLIHHENGMATVWDHRQWRQPLFVFNPPILHPCAMTIDPCVFQSIPPKFAAWSVNGSQANNAQVGEYYVTSDWMGNEWSSMTHYNRLSNLPPNVTPIIYNALTGVREATLPYPSASGLPSDLPYTSHSRPPEIGSYSSFVGDFPSLHSIHGNPGVGMVVSSRDAGETLLYLVLSAPFGAAFTYRLHLDNRGQE